MNQIKLQGTIIKEANTYFVVCNRTNEFRDKIPMTSELNMEAYIGQHMLVEGQWNPTTHCVEATHYSSPNKEKDYTNFEFTGVVKRIPSIRVTKKGREIQDILIQMEGFEKYVKVVAWEKIPEDFDCLDKEVRVIGFLQAREFLKKGTFTFSKAVSYEVSLKRMELVD